MALSAHERELVWHCATRMALSPHEWTWTQQEQELMARALAEKRVAERKDTKLLDDETRDLLHWLAQTVHQAYHQEQPGTFETCPKSICRAVDDFLKARSLENLVAEELQRED